MEKFNKSELEKNDGSEEKPAYVAADGKVYDVSRSRMWKNGLHMKSHRAGTDLSLELQAAPHGPEVLERYEQIGELSDQQEGPNPGFPTPPAPIAFLLDQHPHPILVHFPIALSLAAALFTIVGWLLGEEGLMTAGFYNLVFAAFAAPGAIIAGLLSWYFNYGGIWTPIYRWKAILSAILLVQYIVILLVRLMIWDSFTPDQALYWVYLGLTALLVPLVFSIARLGGKITFPS